MDNTFGELINKKRLEKHITLRAFSRMIGISPEYLSKIENGLRSAPKDDILKRMADRLDFNNQEREMLFDLAAESKVYLSLAIDLIYYISENKIIHKTLRLAKRCNLSVEDWQGIYDSISERYL